MKIKGYFLLILLVISAIGFSVVGYVYRQDVYEPYKQPVVKTPFLTPVFTAAADEVFPWTVEEPEKELPEDLTPPEEEIVEPVKLTKEFATVTDSYFDDALFIGDSRMVGLSDYCEAMDDRGTFYAKKSLTIFDIRDREWIKTEDGRKISLWEAIEGQQFSKIYIMVGINEIGVGDENYFRDAYSEVVNRLELVQPNALIFINSIMHVNAEKNDNDPLYNNTNVNIRNAAIATLADRQKVFYLDINEAVDDENGNLNSEWTSDGVHLKGAYYEPWHQYLLTHGILEEE